jgi:hypothetical protein
MEAKLYAFLTLALMVLSGQLYDMPCITWGKNVWYLLYVRLYGPQSQSELGGEETFICLLKMKP